MIPPATSVLVTHHVRRDLAAESLRHLQGQGFRPHVQAQTETPASWRMRLNVRDALAAVPWAGGVLMFEDDVRLRDGWQRILARVREADQPTVCCVLHRPNLPRPWRDMTNPTTVHATVAPLVRPWEYRGSQCVYLPEWFLHLAWNDPRLHGGPEGMSFDAFLNRLACDPNPIGLMVAIPDMVRHLSAPRVVNGKSVSRPGAMHDWRLA